jgi:hypothetical protein
MTARTFRIVPRKAATVFQASVGRDIDPFITKYRIEGPKMCQSFLAMAQIRESAAKKSARILNV